MSINEADLPVSRRYNVATSFPQAHVSTTTTTSSKTPVLPEGARKFTTTVAFPQSHVSTAKGKTVEFVTGPGGDEGDPGPPGPQGKWESMTQAEYDALPSKNPDTLYVIVP